MHYFYEFHFFDNSYVLIVKTWQKINITGREKDMHFYIKTIQIFNEKLEMEKEIVTEMIPDIIDFETNHS